MKTEEKVGELLKAKNFSLSTAESCTGGGIAALITSVPGSSEYFKGGIVAYSNEIKGGFAPCFCRDAGAARCSEQGDGC